MRHDYDLPPDWNAMTDEEKSDWYSQDRARRQALSQTTTWARKAKDEMEREERKADARNSHVIGNNE
jgi:hypothetical protein